MDTGTIADALQYEETQADEVMLDSMVAEGGIVTQDEAPTADYTRMWDTLEAARDAQTNYRALVVDVVRGGLLVDLGVRAFIPKSELATRHLSNLERFLGQTVEVRVLEADREAGRVVASQRRVVEEKRQARRAATLETLERGQVLDGTVRRITDFGAFVDIGGIDGLLHVSDMSWESGVKAAEMVQLGQKLQVKILKIEREGERISLGMKQLTDDPWMVARRQFADGQVVEVTVTRVESFGAFARLMPGVEGLIPVKELSERRLETAAGAAEVGQTLTVKILEFYPRDRRMSLSVRQAVRDKERGELRDYMHKQRAESAAVPTLGDLFGDVFSKLKKSTDEE
jgi:small subunit ribosomal protein S1